MRRSLYIVLGLGLAFAPIASAVDEPPAPPVAETEAAPVVPNERPIPLERPKAVEKPKIVEKPKPVEKPRLEIDSAGPSVSSPTLPTPAKAIEPTPPSPVSTPGPGLGCNSFGCMALAFAMLILGIGVGFLGRHFMSRHKLGGMTVRIGTWRGIP